jgi:DNA replication initiation complex subunit (GINS family)
MAWKWKLIGLGQRRIKKITEQGTVGLQGQPPGNLTEVE